MFEMLTADQLFRLHDSLYRHATRVHRRMVGPDGRPLMSVYSEAWAVLAACHAELAETQEAVGNELRRRRAEETRADLASCGHPANEDGECSCSYWPERAPHA